MKLKQISLALFVTVVLIAGIFVSCTGNTKEEKNEKQTSKTDTSERQLWTCGMHPEVILDHPGQCPKCGMNLVPLKTQDEKPENKLMNMSGKKSSQTPKENGKRNILYWQAPMDPTEIYDHPGKSKMGMDLIPVYEDEVAKGSTIKIDPVTVQNMGVRTAVVERRPFSRTIRAVGKITYDEQKLFTVSSKISGWIEKLYVNETGQPVRKNQPLLKIYSPELVTTQQEYLLALKNQANTAQSNLDDLKQSARALVQASLQRLLYWDISPDQIRKLQTSGKIQKTLALNAPVNGIVVHKNAIEGMYVKKGMNLFRLADLSTVWVLASIYDSEAPWIKTGQHVRIRLSYDPGREYTGTVTYIYPYLNEKARDIQVRIKLDNPRLILKPGMFANVYLQTQSIPNAVVIPSEAVIRSGKRNIVFVARGKGRFTPREVRLGEEDGKGHIRILSGLLSGDKIVVSAQFMLDSESRLQEAIRKMLAEGKLKDER